MTQPARHRGRTAAVIVACVAAAVLAWHPWSRVSLRDATIILPVPRTVIAPAGRDDVLAVIYSGDGGWADLDRQLGNAFAARGIPVLGVSTFKYYWRSRTVEESAAQLDALLTEQMPRLGKRRLWLIGYSFGADVLPSIVAHLRPEHRTAIAQLVLLAPSRDVTFEIELEGYMIKQGWFVEHFKRLMQHINPIAHERALPPLLALHGQPPVICYYGLDDADDSLCTAPGAPRWLQVRPKPGDHHFAGGYLPLAKELLAELPARAPPR
jgi:type IV secretory pathway VirJ component